MKFTKYSLIALSAIAILTGCGGGGGEGNGNVAPVVEDRESLFNLYGTGIGVGDNPGKTIFNKNSLPGTPSNTFKITSLRANACKGKGVFSPSTFVTEANQTQEISFSIPFAKFEKCITDKITFDYAIVKSGIDLEFTKVITNPAYDQGKVFKEANTDPLFKYQWHLLNTGQRTGVSTPAVAGNDINVVNVWNEGIKGKGVTVAVVDSGVDMFHPDLKDNLLMDLSHNFHTGNGLGKGGINNPTPHRYLVTMDDPNTPELDLITGGWYDYRHGTAVAGIIGAKGWNGIGTRGVAPDANLVSYNALETWVAVNDSESRQLFLAKKIPEVYHANKLTHIRLVNSLTRNLEKIDVYNNSWGSSAQYLSYNIPEINYEDTLKYGLVQGRNGKGSIYVKSAGNGGCWNHRLERYTGWANFEPMQTNGYFIVVGASDSHGDVSSYSTCGPNLLINAPGGGSQSEFVKPDLHEIVTTDMAGNVRGYDADIQYLSNTQHFNVKGNENYDYTQLMNGTSAAAPMVSGVVALMLEANPDLTWRDIRYILAHTATRNNPHSPTWRRNAANIWYSYTYGFGRVNALNAVAFAKNFTSLGGYYKLEREIGGHTRIEKESNSHYTSTKTIDKNIKVEHVRVKLTLDQNSTIEYENHDFSGSGNRAIRVPLYAGLNIFTTTGRFDFNSSTHTNVNLIVDSITADPEKAQELASMSDSTEPFKSVQTVKKLVTIEKDGDYIINVDSNASSWTINVKSPFAQSKASDIQVKLTSPSQTTTTLAAAPNMLDVNQTYSDTQLSSVEFMDENSRGMWTLDVQDLNGSTFEFKKWTLEVVGH